MEKTILITGSTDGLGLQTAQKFLSLGHEVILHGRNPSKLEDIKNRLALEGFAADLANFEDVKNLAEQIKKKYKKIDVLINNAGIYKTQNPITKDDLDVRFAVNTLAPYILTKELKELFSKTSRVVNLSSAAQAPVLMEALAGKIRLNDSEAYAQSKLALTMWSFYLSKEYEKDLEAIIAVNPASFLGSKMVKEAYGMEGKDINIGVDILIKASLSKEFANANGKYFDNDLRVFTNPHNFALDEQNIKELIITFEDILSH